MRKKGPLGIKPGAFKPFFARQVAFFISLFLGTNAPIASPLTAKQESLRQWREITASTAVTLRVFVKGNQIRSYFQGGTDTVYSASWGRERVPMDGYKVSAARLRQVHRRSRLPEGEAGWREAAVIAPEEARRLATNLLEALTPRSPGHGVYYEAFFADQVLYRDAQGVARVAPQAEKPSGVTIDHSFYPEESLDMVARRLEEQLASSHPNDSLIVLLAPNASRFAQPILVDRQQRELVCFSLASLYDSGERGGALKVAADGFSALVLESHGLALLKNPITSVSRLVDATVQDGLRFLRLPIPSFPKRSASSRSAGGMDLVEWEKWLDRHTTTRSVDGSFRLLIDGDQFFPRLRQAILDATNHISADIYLFDRDDVGVEIADLLKQQSSHLPVKVIFDRVCSLVGALLPKMTPSPEDFVPPSSIAGYLRKNSSVQVRPFLNPWISTDHAKIFLIDGVRAWIGGMNLGREYRHEWHDLMVELEGPIVDSLENSFRRDWAHAGPLGDLAYAAAALREPQQAQETEASKPRIKLRRLPTNRAFRKPFQTAVMASLKRAQSYIYIENGYLFERGVVNALAAAQKRGVDVRVILPRVNNFKFGIRSNLVTANRLRKNGVRVYFYPGMTHAKALIVDGWCCTGSANLNHFGLRLCKEENIASSDPALAARLKEELFDPDFARSQELKQPIPVSLRDFLADFALSF